MSSELALYVLHFLSQLSEEKFRESRAPRPAEGAEFCATIFAEGRIGGSREEVGLLFDLVAL